MKGNTMGQKYSHLTYEKRCQISTLFGEEISVKSIAQKVGVDCSTVYREFKRNVSISSYCSQEADGLRKKRRSVASRNSNKRMKGTIANQVEAYLIDLQWSPEQISGYMKVEGMADISHETIYRYIWDDKKQGGDLYKYLRHRGKKYNKRKHKTKGRGVIPGRVDIDQRPSIVEEKKRTGDWELDTIIGKNHKGAIVSMVDRSSKYTKLVLVKDKKASSVTKAIEETLYPIRDKVLTLTTDNGKEFSDHKTITRKLDAQVYFAKPYHSWERGLNEHTNGLVRQYFPKKTRFDTLNPRDVQRVEDLLNCRPRKVLGYKIPVEVFYGT